MDTWTADQVESMKRNGNTAVNKVYNPKNRKPDMPLDADEVDSAMERFVRKKYQEKSLADGKPEPPSRDDYSPTTYSPRPPLEDPDSPPPPVPSKKGKIFGFGLRASSSAYPFSKSDKKKKNQEPRVDSAFPISARGYDSRMDDARYDMTEPELQKKLATLRDMGFTETERNTSLLRRLNGDVERVVETLVRLGPRENGDAGSRQNTRSASAREPAPSSRAQEPSYNPYAQPTVGLSLNKPPEPSTPTSTTTFGSNNPYAPPEHTSTGLEQSFQSMQVSQQPQQALFPHSTGGYPSQPQTLQDPRTQYSMTPPVTSTQYQGFVASPPALPVTSNPFFQSASLSAQSTGTNPFLPQSQVPPSPSSNPFFNQGNPQPVQAPQRQVSLPTTFNPFGIPPAQQSSPQQLAQQSLFQQQDIFGTAPQQPVQQPQFQSQDLFGPAPQQAMQQPNNPFQAQLSQQQAQPQVSGYQTAQSPSPFPNFQYAQPQEQVQQQQFPSQAPQFQQQQQQSPYQQQPQQQYSQQGQPQQQQQFSQQQVLPQQTGRHDKTSILALYNYPSLAPQRLASIPEPAMEQQQQQPPQQFQQQVSPAPSDPFGNFSPAKRSATMPMSLSSMHSAGGAGNRNPFMTNTNAASQNTNASVNPFGGGPSPFTSPAPQPQPQTSPFGGPQAQTLPQQNFAQNNPFGQVQEIGYGFMQGGGQPGTTINYNQGQIASVQQRPVQGIAARHASSESKAVNNLDAGRHSPDAFASLSARYG
ncbi:Protein gts1 [Cladophialophora chaetospira]|uniref:Protein gts1 n=1 Tax=Cladophialophora chaetospira TaxID=386627 RepID=A0AA39CE54_9EURO|nr:Protein gts1 [Cladophialophora chaetospira]